MCKQLADILFPLNILGKKVRCVTYDTPFVPGTSSNNYFDLNIEFKGDRFELRYTKYEVIVHSIWKTPVEEIRNLGFTETINVAAGRRGSYYRPIENKVYIKCTNPTLLIINGEQII